MKSEPDAYSIDQLEEDRSTLWDGIRNYQARNFMRKMKKKDKAFFYHSNCKLPCICGLMKIEETHIIDPTQFDKNSKYFDPKSNKSNPRWDCVKVSFAEKFHKELSLQQLKGLYTGEQLIIVKKGNRLSITPVNQIIAKDILKKVNSNF